MRSHKKKIICMVTAGIMALVMICLAVCMNVTEVQARDTLDGIKAIIAASTAENSYTILEIVPDKAVTTGLTDVLVSGDTVEQSMGTIGYYIGGQEPVQLSRDLLRYKGSEQRKAFVDLLYKYDESTDSESGVLKDITYFEKQDAEEKEPLSFSKYEEKYESTFRRELAAEGKSVEEINAYIADEIAAGRLHVLDYSTTESDQNHVDEITGVKMEAKTGAEVENPEEFDFVKGYLPTDNTPGNEDPAIKFLDENSIGAFELATDGTFDPGFKTVGEGESANFRVLFAATSGTKGYVPNEGMIAIPEKGTDWPAEEPAYKEGMPVYKTNDDGKYELIGYVYKNSVDDGTGTSKNVVGVKDKDGNPITVYPECWNVTFSYTDSVAEGTNVYRITEYSKTDEVMKQYIIDASRPLILNLNGTGSIKVKSVYESANPERFLYEYAEKSGNFKMSIDSTDTTKYHVRGMKIYYRGGFTNKEWFKREVFDREPGDECKNLNLKVVTKSIQEVTTEDIVGARFIYISQPSEDLGKTLLPYRDHKSGETSLTTYAKYGETPTTSDGAPKHDISAYNAFVILKQAQESHIPVVFDYTLNEAATDATKNSNIYKFTHKLCLKDLASFYRGHQASITSTTAEADLQAALDEANKDVDANVNLLRDEKHFVYENIYSSYLTNKDIKDGGDTTVLPLLGKEFRTAFLSTVITERFEEVLDDIQNENLYRETDGNRPPLAETISEATTLRYIINFAQKRGQVEKASIHILELEPTYSFDLSVTNTVDPATKKNNGVLFYKKNTEIINQTDTKIELTQMSVAEFIGKNEDINAKYDMIYIGLNTDLLNIDGSGKTVYNDSSMNGMVYTNVGDYVYCQPHLAGMLNNDYIDGNRSANLRGYSFMNTNSTVGRYRYAGNDITDEKRRALEDFVAAGYPVVVADEMINVSGTVKSASTTVLDNSSNMYVFVKNSLEKNRKNIFRLSGLSTLFNWYLNLSKPVITMSGDAANAKDEPFELKRQDGFYHMTYNFNLKNASAADTATRFDCRVYVDVNADGKFSKTKERVENVVITDGFGNVQEPDASGKYTLAPNTDYVAKRTVSSEYMGVIPWKVEVTQYDNESRRTSATGYYKIERPIKEKIKILQITTDSGTGSGNWNSSNWNLQESLANERTLFHKYVTELNTFELDIKTLTSNQYEDECKNKADFDEYLAQYDMLVLGFADCYQEPDDSKGAMTAIRDYIASGKSILFTHDTTSFVNVPSGQFRAQEQNGRSTSLTIGGENYKPWVEYWGYKFNSLIRDTVGLDRYGVSVNDPVKTGFGYGTGSGEWANITDKSKNGGKDVAYKPGSNRTETVGETQGYTYWLMNNNRYPGLASRLNLKGIDDGDGQTSERGEKYKHSVGKINSGQITMYPYKLEDNFAISTTHGQYYQVNLEADDDGDGESDIVVWYTINNRNSAVTNDLFKMSPNDVRNNYYIFNKGNVTYSGVGHSSIDSKIGSGTNENEIKLFINTMIAAYKAGLRAPEVVVHENADYNSRDINSIYLSYDKMYEAQDSTKFGLLDVTENIYFSADNNSFVEGDQTMSVKCYYVDPNGTETIKVDGEDVKVNEYAIPALYRASTNEGADVNNIASSTVYYFKASTLLLETPSDSFATGTKKNSVQLYLSVTTTLSKNGKTQKMTGIDGVSLVRTQMFNLD